MEKEEFIKQMIALQGEGDTEGNHIIADSLLCQFLIQLGHSDLVAEYHKVEKWFA